MEISLTQLNALKNTLGQESVNTSQPRNVEPTSPRYPPRESEVLLSGDFIYDARRVRITLRERRITIIRELDNSTLLDIIITDGTKLLLENALDIEKKEISPLNFDDLFKIYAKPKEIDAKFKMTISNCDITNPKNFPKESAIVIHAYSEIQRNVWEKYIRSMITSTLLEPFEFYQVIDQFGPFISVLESVSCEDFIGMFQQIDVKYISDTVVYSLFIIFEYLHKDVFTLVKAAIKDEIQHCCRSD